MNTHIPIQHTSRQLATHALLSMLVTAIGVALLIYMILVEDEPGAIPLALMALGIGWFVIARVRLRPHAGHKATSP